MYLRTPKRYRRPRRKLRLFSGRTVLTLLAIPVVGYVGWLIWQNQATVRDSVIPEIEGVAESVQTQIAPQPTPTITPDFMAASAGCQNAYQQGFIEEAIEQCQLLAESRPNDVDLHYRITEMMVFNSDLGSNTERMDDALVFAEKTINANPELPHGWAIQALALDWSGDVQEGLISALHARFLDPSFAPTYAFLGEIYHDLGKSELGLGYLEQALELDTRGTIIAYTLRTKGKIFSDQGGWLDAITPYKAALQNAPDAAYIAVELSKNYIALQQTDEAVRLLVNALQNNPSDTSVLFALAQAQANLGAYDRAYEYYRRCLDVAPDNVACLSWLGGLQFYDGDYAAAINNLKRAIELGSSDPDDFLQLGNAYSALNQCPQAITYLQQGYQIAIDNDDIRRQSSFVNALQNCNVFINAQEER